MCVCDSGTAYLTLLVCLCPHTCACSPVLTHLSLHTCAHTPVPVHLCLLTCAYTPVPVHLCSHTCPHIPGPTHLCLYTCACTPVCTHLCSHLFVQALALAAPASPQGPQVEPPVAPPPTSLTLRGAIVIFVLGTQLKLSCTVCGLPGLLLLGLL